jgi:hypothetical protein
MGQRRWVHVGTSPDRKSFAFEKARIAAASQKFIEKVLKPRFLSEVRPTAFNYPIDICGRWYGNNYRFIERDRSVYADNAGEEFDAPFTRLEYVARDCFNLSFFRHTGQWHLLHRNVALSDALGMIESDGLLNPL